MMKGFENTRVVLASRSPRRRELLGNFIFDSFDIIPAFGEEPVRDELSPEENVRAIAAAKAAEVASKLSPDVLVIAADTLVFDGKLALGKPKSSADAARMLRALSGREHCVSTGVCVMYQGRVVTEAETTKVFFRELTDNEIDDYVKTGDPMDKAGAYGIQGGASVFIPRIEGDYFNIMGLPVCRLYSILTKLAGSAREGERP